MALELVALSAPGHRLRPDAAASFERAVDQGAWQGHPIKVTDSARPLHVQEAIFLDRYRPCAQGFPDWAHPAKDARHWRGRRYVRRKGTAMAAVPGTSKHGSGVALDCGYPWNSWHAGGRGAFERVMARNGWTFPIPSEPWHAEYDPRRDRYRGAPVRRWLEVQKLLNRHGFKVRVDGLPGAQTNSMLRRFQASVGLAQDADPGPATMAALRGFEVKGQARMLILRDKSSGRCYMTDGVTRRYIPTLAELAMWRKHANMEDVDAAIIDSLLDADHAVKRVEQNNHALGRIEKERTADAKAAKGFDESDGGKEETK